MTKHYLVAWEVDIWAESPREAAKEARRIQRARGSTATVFSVKEKGSGKTADIDLEEFKPARSYKK